MNVKLLEKGYQHSKEKFSKNQKLKLLRQPKKPTKFSIKSEINVYQPREVMMYAVCPNQKLPELDTAGKQVVFFSILFLHYFNIFMPIYDRPERNEKVSSK